MNLKLKCPYCGCEFYHEVYTTDYERRFVRCPCCKKRFKIKNRVIELCST